MKQKLLNSSLLFLGVLITTTVQSQCEINASANPLQIYCGQSSILSAYGIGEGTVIMNENFNSGFGPGWSSTPGATSFSNPCSPNGADNTPHAWMDANTSVPRTLTSAPFNLSTATAGVTICFDLLFATQGGNAPCEGPDEPDEGVYFQYSTNGGSTWTTIYYFDPNGGYNTPYTSWNNWCFQIPVAAITSSTMFRWHQTADSGASYDHWGIDNVQIVQNDVNAEVVWGHDGYSYGVGSSGGANPTSVSPTSTTTYPVTITTGTGVECTTSITVVVLDPVYEVDVNVNPSTICVGECAEITGTAQQVLDPGGIETYANAETGPIFGTPGFTLPFIGPVPGEVSAEMNINVVGINQPTVTNGLITSVCITNFVLTSFGGSTSLADLEVVLTCPGGTSVNLVNVGDLSGNIISGLCFELGAPPLSSGSAPYSGTFAPAQSWAGLNGCASEGVWNLTLEGANYDFSLPIGGINGWNITFDDPPLYGPVTVSWSPTTGLSNPNLINTQACPTSSTNYQLTVSNGVQGCATHTETVAITVDPCGGCVPPAITIDPLTTCAPNTLNLANAINPSSQTATITYHATQSDAQNNLSPISTTVAISGTYWVRAEDPNDPDCFGVHQIVATINTQDNATFSFDNFCLGASNGPINIATIGGTFAFSPIPSDGATINPTTGIISNAVAGTTYTIQYTTNGTCPATSTLPVSVSEVTFTTTVVGENCGNDDGEITINPTSGSSPYLFTLDNGTPQSTGTFSNLSSGSYQITITDDSGCIATGTAVVSIVGGATINDSDFTNPTCAGLCDGTASATVSGGTLPYTFEWTDAIGTVVGNTSSVSDLCEGVYTLTVYDDANGPACSVSINITLTDPTTGDASFQVTDFCEGATNSASGIATPGGTFSFNPAPGDGATINTSTGEISNGIGGTTYSIEYSVGSGTCLDTHVETVTVFSNPTPTISGDLSYCNTAGVTLDAGSGYSNYSWSSGENTQTITATAQTGLTVTVTSANGCIATSPAVTISEGGISLQLVNSTSPDCNQANGTIQVSASGGDGNYQYSINGQAFTGNDLFINLPAGNHTIEAVDGSGVCSADISVNLVSASGPSITSLTSTNVTCFGLNNGTVSVQATGSNPLTYSLTDGISNIYQTNATGNFTDVNPGTYTVVVTDPSNCLFTQVVTITEPSELVLSLTFTDETCNASCNGSINWQTQGGSTPVSVSVNGINNTMGSANSLCPGNYTIVATDENGCNVTGNVIINSGSEINIDAIINTPDGCDDGCDGSIVATASNGVSYTLNGQTNTTGIFPNLCGGTYNLTVTNTDGCTSSASITVLSDVAPIAEFGFNPNDPTIFETEVDFNNYSSNATSYSWEITNLSMGYYYSTNEMSFTHSFDPDTATYNVCLIAYSQTGCSDTLCKELIVYDDIMIYVPNTFTPDGDEFNQMLIFYVNGIDRFDFEFQIFNRWGERVFESRDATIGWDGTYNGAMVQSGTYTWKMTVKNDRKDFRKTLTGHVNVLR